MHWRFVHELANCDISDARRQGKTLSEATQLPWPQSRRKQLSFILCGFDCHVNICERRRTVAFLLSSTALCDWEMLGRPARGK